MPKSRRALRFSSCDEWPKALLPLAHGVIVVHVDSNELARGSKSVQTLVRISIHDGSRFPMNGA